MAILHGEEIMLRYALLVVLTSLSSLSGQDLPASEQTEKSNVDYTVLLITSEELAPAWHEFADWKTQCGKRTRIVTVSEAKESHPHKVVQESIRLLVRDYIENHQTRWVILGGDCTPDGKGVVPGGHTTIHDIEPHGIPTDIVYISPTDWDADGDGVYGEWNDDRSAITYPDGTIGLGRIPVRTADDVEAFTEKVIQYESQYPTDSFASEMVYTCTVPGAYPKVRRSWDDYVSKAWKAGSSRRYFSDETPWDKPNDPGSYDLSANNLLKLINKKSVGKIHLHGHGFLPAWVLDESYFTLRQINQLSNEGAYPLITTVSCFTGQYDADADPSIVESMIRKPKGGSVAIVAPVRTGKPHFAKRSDLMLMVTEGKLDGTTQTMTRYWTHGLGENKTTGEAIMLAKADMAEDAKASPNYHLCVCELNLLGDPTLDMRATSPRKSNVVIPASVPAGKQTIQLQTDTPGVTVCLWQANTYLTATADEAGEVRFDCDLEAQRKVKLTITGPSLNAQTYEILCGISP